MYRGGRIGWTSSKLITRIISIGSSHTSEPQHHQSSPRGTPPKFRWNKGEVHVLHRKRAISLKGGKIWPKYWWPIESPFVLLIGAKINDLGWPWRAITHSVSKHVRLSELTRKISMKIDYTISDDDVAPCSESRFWQYKVYADIRGGSQDLCKFVRVLGLGFDFRALWSLSWSWCRALWS